RWCATTGQSPTMRRRTARSVSPRRLPNSLLPEAACGGGVGSPSERIRRPGGRGPRARAPAAPPRDAPPPTAPQGRGRCAKAATPPPRAGSSVPLLFQAAAQERRDVEVVLVVSVRAPAARGALRDGGGRLLAALPGGNLELVLVHLAETQATDRPAVRRPGATQAVRLIRLPPPPGPRP